MVGTQKYTDEEAEFILSEKQRGTSIIEIVKLCMKKWPRSKHEWSTNGVRYVASSYKKLPQYKKFAEDSSENPYPNLLGKPKPKPKPASKTKKLDEDSDEEYVPNSPSSSPLIRKHASTGRGRQLLPSAPPLKSSRPYNLLRASDEKKSAQEWGRNHWDEDDVFGGGLESQMSFSVGLQQHNISENEPQNPADNDAGPKLQAHDYPGAAMEPISGPRKASGKRAGASSRKQTDSVSKEEKIAFSNPSKFLTKPNKFKSREEAVRAQQNNSAQSQYGYHTNGYDQSLMPDFDPDALLQQPNPYGSLEEAMKAQASQKSRNKRLHHPEDVQMSEAHQTATPQPQEKRPRTDTPTTDVDVQDSHSQATPTSSPCATSDVLQQPMSPKHFNPLLGKNSTPQGISRASTPASNTTPHTLRQPRATSYSRHSSPHTPYQANTSMVASTPATRVKPNFLKTRAIRTPLSPSFARRGDRNIPLDSQDLISDLGSTAQYNRSLQTNTISYRTQGEPRTATPPASKFQFSLSALTSAAFADQFLAVSKKSQGPLPFPSVKSQLVKPATPTGQQPTESLRHRNHEMDHDATASMDFTLDRSDHSTQIQDPSMAAHHHSNEMSGHQACANNLISNQASLPPSPPRPSVEEPQFTPKTSPSLSPMDYAQDLPVADTDTPNTMDGSYDFSHFNLFNSFGSFSSPPSMSTPLMSSGPYSPQALWDNNNTTLQDYPKPRTLDVASYQQAKILQKQYPDQSIGEEESLKETWEEKQVKKDYADPIDDFTDFSTY